MGALKNKIQKEMLKLAIDKFAGPLDDIASLLGVDIADKAADKIVNGSSDKLFDGNKELENYLKRIDKYGGPSSTERILTSLGEYAIPEASRGIGNVLGNNYETLARIASAMRGGMPSAQREMYGMDLHDKILARQEAMNLKKAANSREIADRVANSIQGMSRYNRKENEKIRTLKTSADPYLEGRTGMLRETRMMGKDAERVQRED